MGSSGVSQVIAAAQPIVLVPMFLSAWGASGYGRWLVLTALVSYLSMLDLGGQNYIGNLLAIDYAQGKHESFRDRLSEGVSLFLGIALTALFLVAVLLFGVMSPRVPGLGNLISMEERWILLFLASAFLFSVPSGVYVSAYRASGLFVRGTMLGNVFRLLHLAASVVLLWLAVRPFIFALVVLIANVSVTVFMLWDSRRVMESCRHIRIGLREAKRGTAHVSGALEFWLLVLANGLNQQGVLLVLAAFSSPVTVALFATHRTAAGALGYVGSVLQAPLWPELSFLWARQRTEELRTVTFSAIRLVMFLSGLAALVLWAVLPFIYPLWTGRQLELRPALLIVMLMQGVLAAGWFTSGWALLAANKHRVPARWSLANAILTIVLALAAAPRYGVLGVAVATLTGDVVCGLLAYPRVAGRMLGVNATSLYQAMLLAFSLLLPLVAVVVIGGRILHGWTFIFAFGIAVVVWSILSTPIVLERAVIRRIFSALASSRATRERRGTRANDGG